MKQSIKIQIKSILGKLLFEHEKENNTLKEAIEQAIKEGADLSGANLSGANLSGADLRFNTILSSTKTDKKILQLCGIGSANRMTTYIIEEDVVFCGWFKGSLSEFEKRVNKTHESNPRYLAEYSLAIEYFKKQKELNK